MGRVAKLYKVIFEEVGYDVPPIETESIFKDEEVLKETWAGETGGFKLVGYERIMSPDDSFFIQAGIFRETDILWEE